MGGDAAKDEVVDESAEDEGVEIVVDEDGQIEIEMEGQVGTQVVEEGEIEIQEEGEVTDRDRDEFEEDVVRDQDEEEEGEDGEIIIEEGEFEEYEAGVGMVEEGEVVEQEEHDSEEMPYEGKGPNSGIAKGEDGAGTVDVSGAPREVEDGELVDDEEEAIVSPALGVGTEASGVVRPNPDNASASGLEEGEVVDLHQDEEQVQVADEEVDMELDSDGEGYIYGRIETIHALPHEAGGGFLHLVMALFFSQGLLFSFRPLSCRYIYACRACICLYRHSHTTPNANFNLDGHSATSFDCIHRRTLEVQTETEARQTQTKARTPSPR